jgi:hypothetical protein
VHFLGATLWTDYRLFGEAIAQAAMQRAQAINNDHRRIRIDGGHWTAKDAAGEHHKSRVWLRDAIAARSGERLVVVTHTAPSIGSIASQYKNDLVTAAFASNLEELAVGVKLWVHGHTHLGCDYQLAIAAW